MLGTSSYICTFLLTGRSYFVMCIYTCVYMMMRHIIIYLTNPCCQSGFSCFPFYKQCCRGLCKQGISSHLRECFFRMTFLEIACAAFTKLGCRLPRPMQRVAGCPHSFLWSPSLFSRYFHGGRCGGSHWVWKISMEAVCSHRLGLGKYSQERWPHIQSPGNLMLLEWLLGATRKDIVPSTWRLCLNQQKFMLNDPWRPWRSALGGSLRVIGDCPQGGFEASG